MHKKTARALLPKAISVRLAFAMTIDKSQGQTLDKVGLQLNKNDCFGYSHLYTAISRVSSWSRVQVKLDDNANRKCTNVVYKDVL